MVEHPHLGMRGNRAVTFVNAAANGWYTSCCRMVYGVAVSSVTPPSCSSALGSKIASPFTVMPGRDRGGHATMGI
ncbi:hypothetical protein GUJ93_ZPchr0015g6967 [Zizania palustris]|uniref:Uncharacterized protein n=1 Tax=Zizania palustris TaxID=103762 RepID=A0A8J5TAX3_ZIZPA|nr:hypothetical protein GUJ93_ZPchr0015g6967 [Zizania palustris]